MENVIIKIIQDRYPDNPRREWDNLGTMVCKHGRYDLGDNINFKPWQASSWEEYMAEYFQDTYSVIDEFGNYDTYERDIKKIWKWIDANVVWLPLYLYDHSGITMSCGSFRCGWDSGQVGFIYCTKETILKEYGGKILTKKLKERIALYLEGEVETYDQYLTGDVYGFVLEKWNPEPGIGWEETESCWGFFGSDPKENGMLEYIPKEYHHLLDEVELEYA